jgi:hypothetical protein
MAISHGEISSRVEDIHRDAVFETAVEPDLDFGIERLNRDGPHIQVTDHTVVSGDMA